MLHICNDTEMPDNSAIITAYISSLLLLIYMFVYQVVLEHHRKS